MKQSTKLSNTSTSIEHILYSIDNYKPTINYLLQDILTKFLTIIIEFLTIINEKISIKNRQYYLFIVERGLETIIHVFSLIFYYTKNLELTFYHSQKAYYFYIEFIEQISDDNVTFLQLSSKDAVLFVYKKTIYDLNNEYKKNMVEPNEDEKILLNTLDIYIQFYKTLVIHTLYNSSTNNNKEVFDECYKCMENVTESLIKHNKPKKSQIDLVYIFTTLLNDKTIDLNTFYQLIQGFSEKIVLKKKYDENSLKRKIYDYEMNALFLNQEYDKIIGFIFNE